MADIARAMQTPPPASEQVPQTKAPQQAPPSDNLPFTRQGTGEKAAVTRADNAARDAKNKRDQARRKAKRAADAKAKLAATKKAAAPKRRKKKTVRVHALTNAAVAPTKKAKRRGRPPGAKNKPKVPPVVGTVFSAPTPRATTVGMGTDPFSVFLTVRDMLARLVPAQRVQVLAALVNEK